MNQYLDMAIVAFIARLLFGCLRVRLIVIRGSALGIFSSHTMNCCYLVMTNNPDQRAKIYYSTDGTEPTILYSDTVALSNLADVQAISKRFGSYTVDTARYEVTYVYDGVTARTASGGLLKNAFEWCGTDKIEMYPWLVKVDRS